jgi:hypothetical protein
MGLKPCDAPRSAYAVFLVGSNVVPRTVPLVFTIRMDPFESSDNKGSYGHLMQNVSWLIQPMGELMRAHLKTPADYPPVRGGASFDMSNVVQEFINKAKP